MAKEKKQTEEKPNRKAKQNLYDVIVKPNLEKVKDWYRNGATEEEVAKKLGISLRSLHNYKTRYPEFLEAVSKSRDIADAEVEAALFKRAIGYKYTEITKERIIDKSQKARHEQGEFELTEDDKGELLVTKEVIKSVAPDVTAQIFWLKNRRSDKWRDKQDIEHSGNVGVTIVKDVPLDDS